MVGCEGEEGLVKELRAVHDDEVLLVQTIRQVWF